MNFNKNGFSLLESLFALLVILILCSLATAFFHCSSTLVSLPNSHQNQLGILQLRQMLALSSSIEVNSDSISYIYNHKTFTISFSKDRLVKEPGYEIILSGIEASEFFQEGESIYFFYEDKKVQIY
jgi:prepilin-type N-terminal cleavage/methylation domain-containing protein